MRYLIVNGDDFGASRGINRGILEAHQRGILTSASLMVNARGSEEAAALGRAAAQLSVGLHVWLEDGGDCRAELPRQLSRFEDLMSQPPSHLDSHHNVHRDPRLLPHFLDFAREHNLSLRAHSPIRSIAKFYGQWGGESHAEQISAVSLACILKTELEAGVTELSCHPGYTDAGFSSSYTVEREIELRALCDPLIRRVLAEHSIRLINHREVAGLPAGLPA